MQAGNRFARNCIVVNNRRAACPMDPPEAVQDAFAHLVFSLIRGIVFSVTETPVKVLSVLV